MADTEDTATVAGELDEALLKAISHPLRHRLLGLLDDRTASPNELARELRLPRAARRGIVGQSLQRIFSDVTAAVDAGGFDGKASQVKRTALELDERGL